MYISFYKLQYNNGVTEIQAGEWELNFQKNRHELTIAHLDLPPRV